MCVNYQLATLNLTLDDASEPRKIVFLLVFQLFPAVTALIECGVCVPSNYTGFYIKCNLLRNKENRPTIYRPLTVLGHSATIL